MGRGTLTWPYLSQRPLLSPPRADPVSDTQDKLDLPLHHVPCTEIATFHPYQVMWGFSSLLLVGAIPENPLTTSMGPKFGKGLAASESSQESSTLSLCRLIQPVARQLNLVLWESLALLGMELPDQTPQCLTS